MKYPKFLLLVASAFLSLSILSFEPWNGDKLFINKELSRPNAFIVNLKGFGEATLTTKDGVTAAKFKFSSNNEELVLDMRNNTDYKTSFLLVDTLDSGVTQVEAKETILEMTLTDAKYQTNYKTKSKICYTGYDPKTQRMGQDACEVKESELSRYPVFDSTNLSQPLFRNFIVNAGDKLSLPTEELHQDIYVTLNKDGSVGMLDTVSKIDIKSWKNVEGKLILTTSKGSTFEYQKLRDVHGLSQVLLTINVNDVVQNQKILIGQAAKNEGLNLSDLQMNHFAGEYISATYTSGEPLIYEFNNDGFGGFQTPNDDYSKWAWKVENGLIIADRYSILDEDGNSTDEHESDEEYKKCISGEIKCHKYQTRSYQILSKDGNRFILRRKLLFNHAWSNDDSADINSKSSLWVFYKK